MKTTQAGSNFEGSSINIDGRENTIEIGSTTNYVNNVVESVITDLFVALDIDKLYSEEHLAKNDYSDQIKSFCDQGFQRLQETNILLVSLDIGDRRIVEQSCNVILSRICKHLEAPHFYRKSKDIQATVVDSYIQARATDSNIFFLENAAPENIDSFSNIRDFLRQRNSYLVVSTDQPFKNWKYKDSHSYHVDYPKIKSSFWSEAEACSEFKSKQLSDRDRLILLGLTLLPSLREEQFFSALEIMFRDAWQKRDPNLKSIDYADVDRFNEKYFYFAGDTLFRVYGSHADYRVIVNPELEYYADISRILIGDEDSLNALLKAAWDRDSYRRLVTSGADILVSIVQGSADSNYRVQRWELYGDESSVGELTSSISRTLTKIGLISASSSSIIRRLIYRLFVSNEYSLRSFAATVIAGWTVDDSTFYETLKGLYCNANSNYKLSGSQDDDPHLEDALLLFSTASLALKEASLNFPKNHLDEKLLDWIKEMTVNPLCFASVISPKIEKVDLLLETIPTLLQFHIEQVSDEKFLDEILQSFIVVNSVGLGFLYASISSVDSRAVVSKIQKKWLSNYKIGVSPVSRNLDSADKDIELLMNKVLSVADFLIYKVLFLEDIEQYIDEAFYILFSICSKSIEKFSALTSIGMRKAYREVPDLVAVKIFNLYSKKPKSFELFCEKLISELSISNGDKHVVKICSVFDDDKSSDKLKTKVCSYFGLFTRSILSSKDFDKLNDGDLSIDAAISQLAREIVSTSDEAIPDQFGALLIAYLIYDREIEKIPVFLNAIKSSSYSKKSKKLLSEIFTELHSIHAKASKGIVNYNKLLCCFLSPRENYKRIFGDKSSVYKSEHGLLNLLQSSALVAIKTKF